MSKNIFERAALAVLVPLMLFTLAKVLEAEKWRGMIEERVHAIGQTVERIENSMDRIERRNQ